MFESLDKRYKTVVIDPPWSVIHGWEVKQESEFNSGLKRRLPYETLSDDALRNLDLNHILDDDCLIFVWTLNQKLRFTFDLIESWGLKYWFMMTWVKNGGPQMPNSPMFNAEWIAVAKKGDPKFRDIRQFFTANCWSRTKHSAKPEEFYDLLRRVTEAPRIDIFNRRAIRGFDTWGDESAASSSEQAYFQQPLFHD